MKKILTIMFFIFALIESSNIYSHAAGPLVVKGSMAISYGTRPLLYRYDKGTLGMFSNSEAISIFESVFKDWENIKSAQAKFKQDSPGSLDSDITAKNYKSLLETDSFLGYTPVVFDTDGSLLNALIGDGANSQVLGFAGPITANSGPFVNEIAESQAVFNGRFVNGIDTPSDPETSLESFQGTIKHEFGHGIGLDHSQINVEAIRPGATQEIRDAVPLEFPVAVNDLSIIRQDDISSVSLLYPNESELTKFGKIEGKVFRKDGSTPVRGANVIARNIENPTLLATSCVSDYLNDGAGLYTLFALPPGKYRIEVEPIDISFNDKSGIGPHTQTTTDLSFQNPVPKGFYAGPDLPITADSDQALVVDVQAGQFIMDANIIASTTFSPSSSSSSGGSSGGSSGSITSNEKEPNNSVSTAQVITPPVTISGNASSSDPGDIDLTSDSGSMVTISDLYKFTISSASSINALLTNQSENTNDDLDLVLFDESASGIIDTSSQTGNTDELISTSIPAGTYILGVGAFSGSANYSLAVTTSSDSGGPPALTLSGKDTLVLRPGGKNQVAITANGFNFTSSSKCEVLPSNGTLVKVKPRKFSLNSVSNKKKFTVRVPKSQALTFIMNNNSEIVTLNVTCDNGANDQFDLNITPNSDQATSNKVNWRITRRK